MNIHSSIQNFNERERVLRPTYDTMNRKQDTIFLTSDGIYRLLFNSKKPAAEEFRAWASNILDDIIFNKSAELQKKLKEKKFN